MTDFAIFISAVFVLFVLVAWLFVKAAVRRHDDDYSDYSDYQ